MKTLSLLILAVATSGCQKDSTASGTAANQSHATTLPGDEVIRMDSAHETIDTIIKEVMDEQYGTDRDAKLGCWWHFVSQGDNVRRYCMKPGPRQLVDTKDGKRLLFIASSVPDMGNDEPQYAYGQEDPGLMGAFSLTIPVSGSWKYFASEKEMEFGTVGYCGCDKAQLAKLSNDGHYGWLFAHGGIWQGVVVSTYSIVASHDGRFKDIAGIPEISEEEQDVRNEIRVLESSDASGMFPILVAKTRGGVKVGEHLVKFDQANWSYGDQR